MRRILATLVWVIAAAATYAHTMSKEDFVCPLCATKFTQMMDMSGTQFGMRLDLKPEGPTAAPWRLPVCPKCHFVFFKSWDEKYADEEIADLKKFVGTDSYKKAGETESSYFLLALLQEHLRQNTAEIGFSYLRASWQVEPDPDKCRRYQAAALAKYQEFLKTAPRDDKMYVTAQLVKGEMLRRLGRFDEADKQFKALKGQGEFEPKHFQAIIRQQLALVGQRDSGPHSIEATNRD